MPPVLAANSARGIPSHHPNDGAVRVTFRQTAVLFLAAVAIRWCYALLLFATMGEEALKGVDSHIYLLGAHVMVTELADHSLTDWHWLGPHLHVMPLFAWSLALHLALFGAWGVLAFVLSQGLMDAATCLVVSASARQFDERYALPAGIAAAINPTQIVLSAIVFTDTQFVFFAAVSLYAAVRWMNSPAWRWPIICAAALGAAALTRPLGALWMPVLIAFLLFVFAVRRQLSKTALTQIAAAGAIMALCLAPVLWRNVTAYGSWSLTSQSGLHLARWVVPLVKEARDRTPWHEASEDMERLTRERFGPAPSNQFELSRQYSVVAREKLAELGLAPMVKAWGMGALINVGAPALVLSPPVANLHRTGFFATPGQSMFDKVANFLFRSDDRAYSWLLLAGIGGVIAMRAFQLVGFAAVLRVRAHWPALSLFALWIAFILAVNGPIASPKYRLPIEPPLMVLAGAGFAVLLRQKKQPERGG